MDRADELARENEALRERLSRLSEASLRINESLDFQAVLQSVLDSACSLTGARYGVITLLDRSGRVEDFLYSGLTPEETALFGELPDGMAFFEYLGRIEGPLRLRDFHSHVRELGLPEFRPPFAVSDVLPFLAAPIRHLGERVGAFYVGEKEQEFTPEDEETLVAFASQAALVIANARRHRDEQRARADLETLVNTAPVGVVVFDARTGNVVSINREMRRITGGLHGPEGSAEQALGTLSFRRADGREVSLQEFSFTYLLSLGETVRAEEIVLRAPGGRSITTLLNATPIRSEQGEVESFVITLQDMTQVEELERLRAEFLAMVSHELRAPLISIKGSAATVISDASTFGPAEMVQFFRIIDRQADSMSRLINDLLDVARIETGTLSVNPQPVLVAALVDQARSAFVSGGGRDNLRIGLPPDLPRVMADPRRIVQVLGNLLSNAARHSPETSPILISAAHDDFPRRGVGGRPGQRAAQGAAVPPLSEVLPAGGGRARGHRSGPGDKQGDRGGPRREDLGGERGAGPRGEVHLHCPGGGGCRAPSGDRTGGAGLRRPAGGEGAGARPGGGRRPPGAAVHPRRPHQGRVRGDGHRRPGRGPEFHGGQRTPSGLAGPDAAGD